MDEVIAEAGKLKLIAEEMLQQHDYVGARRYAMRAQFLYPDLDGISQLVATIQVYVSAKHKIRGEIDWYRVLGVNPTEEDDVIKKCYRKLALVLHPDKNPSAGAHGAFQIVQEAWSMISDKDKRLAYNERRGNRGIQLNASMKNGDQSTPPTKAYEFYDFMGTSTAPAKKEQTETAKEPTTASAKEQNDCVKGPSSTSSKKKQNTPTTTVRSHKPKAAQTHKPAPAPSPASTPTDAPSQHNDHGHNSFWTSCQPCNIYFRYAMEYLNQNLLCPNCKKPFLAVKRDPPARYAPRANRSHPGRQKSHNINVDYAKDDLHSPNAGVTQPSRPSSASPNTFSSKDYQQNPHSARYNVGSTSTQTSTADRTDPGSFVFGSFQQGPFPGSANFGSRLFPGTASFGNKYNQTFVPGQADHFPFMFQTYPQPAFPGMTNFVGTYDQTPFPFMYHQGFPGTANFGGAQQGPFPGTANVGGASGQTSMAGHLGPSLFAKYQQASLFEASNIGCASSQAPGVGQEGHGIYRDANYRQRPLFGMANIGGMDPSVLGKTANVAQHRHEQHKRPNTESHSSAGRKRSIKKGKRIADTSRHGIDLNMPPGDEVSETASASGSRTCRFSEASAPQSTIKELSSTDARKLLITKAKNEILSKLDDLMSKSKENRKNEESRDQNRSAKSSAKKRARKTKRQRGTVSANDKGKGCPPPVTMAVPDSDFYDFDQDRTEYSVAENEVWSAYDDDDGMPRFYALINRVVSRQPFEITISWLNSRTNSEFSSIDWSRAGFSKTCGRFRVGRHVTLTSVNIFSQKVEYTKGHHGAIVILPQKGDVWALYRHWSPDWSSLTSTDVVNKYDMVMVVDDYHVEQGISVAPLMKVSGFKTVFRPNMDKQAFKRIPKEEMFKFSHQVPHHLLSDEEGHNVPKGCLEVDPAATPNELMQVITENSEELLVDTKVDKTQVPSTSLDDATGQGTGKADAVTDTEQQP